MSSTVLYKLDKNGKVRAWYGNREGNVVHLFSGVKDGKMIKHSRAIKGLTKTSDIEQAELYLERQYTKMKKKGYEEKGDTNTYERTSPRRLIPMKVHKFSDHNSKIIFPCIIQPKLDGLRCLAECSREHSGEGSLAIKLISACGNEFPFLLHIKKSLKEILSPILNHQIILDGELMLNSKFVGPQDNSFNLTTSICKRTVNRHPEEEKVCFNVFDVAIPSMEFSKRSELLETLIPFSDDECIRRIPGIVCNNLEEMYEHHRSFEGQGYEGLIARNLRGIYKFGFRSYDVQKIKSFEDDEFLVVDYLAGEGSDEGCIIFVCKSNIDNTTFNVRMTGTQEKRREMFQRGDAYIGKFVKVKYQGSVCGSVPRFPVALGIRDEIDT